MATKRKSKKTKRSKRGKADGRLIKADLSHYAVSEERTASGHKVIDCDDAVAQMLRGKTLDEAYKLASKYTGESMKALKARYGRLNLGMVRMNLSNRIRKHAG